MYDVEPDVLGMQLSEGSGVSVLWPCGCGESLGENGVLIVWDCSRGQDEIVPAPVEVTP
jgi:hypothetical protein